MNQFISDKPLVTHKKFDIFETKDSTKFALTHHSSKLIEEEMDQEMNEYLFNAGDWAPYFHISSKENLLQNENNPFLGEILFGTIDNLFPRKAELPKPDFPNHLPLKLSFVGVPLAGKRTLANVLKQKYGVEPILPEDIIKEAITYAFPPEEVIDPKKPKKKPEKNDKKVEEVKDNPELRSLGVKAKGLVDGGEGINDEILMEAILYKIRSLFLMKNSEELTVEIREEKNKAAEKLKEIKKQQEEAEKKAKKAVKTQNKGTQKKGAPVPAAQEEVQQTPEEKLQELINKNPFYFTKGFALINFPRTMNQVYIYI